MFTKILAPIQNRLTDQVVFDTALSLAQQTSARLMLLRVFSPEMRAAPALPNPTLYRYPMVTDELMLTYRQRWEDLENSGLEMLKQLSEQAQASGITVEFTQNFGNVGQVICEVGENWGADLIVTRQPDRSKLDELFLGSISNYVLHHASCPVLAIPQADDSTLR
ncbi:MAG: universal stress protein [Leptolyngbya sp. SIO4C1]|nr:universal stress protein [Leptolyngbya sp. SIO4C1]